MNNEENYILNKIDIDEKTLEPSIVEESSIIEQDKKTIEEEQKRVDREERRSLGQQMFMKHVIGYVPSENVTEKRQKLYKRIFTVLFIVVVISVLGWTFYHDFFSPEALKNPPSFSEITYVLSQNWYYFLFALIALALCFFFKGLKLSVMCRSVTGRWRFKTCFETGIIGHYYNNVTPLASGGQPFEIYHLSRHGVSGGAASSMPIASFFMYQLAFVVLSSIALIFFVPSVNALMLPSEIIDSPVAYLLRPMAVVGTFFGILMPLLVIIFCIFPSLASSIVKFTIRILGKLKLVKDEQKTCEKFIETVNQNSKCLKDMAKSPLVLVLSFLTSACEVLSLCSIAYFILRSFGFDFPASWHVWEWSQIVVVCLVLYSSVSFIPTPGNSGVADVSFYWLFKLSLFGIGGLSFIAMLTWRILSYYSFILIGFLFTTTKRKNDRKKERMGIPLYKD